MNVNDLIGILHQLQKEGKGRYNVLIETSDGNIVEDAIGVMHWSLEPVAVISAKYSI